MKKVYESPEMVFTSFEANDSLMVNPLSSNQTTFNHKTSAEVFSGTLS